MSDTTTRIITINNMPPSANTDCRECGHNGPANEYHPYMFCVLYKAGWTTERIWTDIRLATDEAGDR